MIITKHFKLEEFERSETAQENGIDNKVPDIATLVNINLLCYKILEPLRYNFGPCVITSGYRSKELNSKLGGAENSAHMLGLAADVYFPESSLRIAYEHVVKSLIFDECYMYCLENEPLFMHLSFAPPLRMKHKIVDM